MAGNEVIVMNIDFDAVNLLPESSSIQMIPADVEFEDFELMLKIYSKCEESQQIGIFYLDTDNDYVIISSNEELKEAFKFAKGCGNVLKVLVKAPGGPQLHQINTSPNPPADKTLKCPGNKESHPEQQAKEQESSNAEADKNKATDQPSQTREEDDSSEEEEEEFVLTLPISEIHDRIQEIRALQKEDKKKRKTSKETGATKATKTTCTHTSHKVATVDTAVVATQEDEAPPPWFGRAMEKLLEDIKVIYSCFEKPAQNNKGLAPTPAAKHYGVNCDSCNQKDFPGVRYKCGNCPDFDLCEKCEAQREHGHDRSHVFLKIYDPPSFHHPGALRCVLLKRNLYADTDRPVRGKEKDKKGGGSYNYYHMRTHKMPMLPPMPGLKREDMYPRVPLQQRDDRLKRRMEDEAYFSKKIREGWPSASPEMLRLDCTLLKFPDDPTPDGIELPPGAKFLKYWRLRNSGTAPWAQGTTLRLMQGSLGGEPTFVAVPFTYPNEEVDLVVELKAPYVPGTYQNHWRLCHCGEYFGKTMWCLITVVGKNSPPNLTYVVDYDDETVERPAAVLADTTHPISKHHLLLRQRVAEWCQGQDTKVTRGQGQAKGREERMGLLSGHEGDTEDEEESESEEEVVKVTPPAEVSSQNAAALAAESLAADQETGEAAKNKPQTPADNGKEPGRKDFLSCTATPSNTPLDSRDVSGCPTPKEKSGCRTPKEASGCPTLKELADLASKSNSISSLEILSSPGSVIYQQDYFADPDASNTTLLGPRTAETLTDPCTAANRVIRYCSDEESDHADQKPGPVSSDEMDDDFIVIPIPDCFNPEMTASSKSSSHVVKKVPKATMATQTLKPARSHDSWSCSSGDDDDTIREAIRDFLEDMSNQQEQEVYTSRETGEEPRLIEPPHTSRETGKEPRLIEPPRLYPDSHSTDTDDSDLLVPPRSARILTMQEWINQEVRGKEQENDNQGDLSVGSVPDRSSKTEGGATEAAEDEEWYFENGEQAGNREDDSESSFTSAEEPSGTRAEDEYWHHQIKPEAEAKTEETGREAAADVEKREKSVSRHEEEGFYLEEVEHRAIHCLSEKVQKEYQKVPTGDHEAQFEYREDQSEYHEAPSGYQDVPEEYQEAPTEYQEAPTEYQEAPTEYQEAQAEYQESNPEYQKAAARYHKAVAELNDATAGYYEVEAEYKELVKEYPELEGSGVYQQNQQEAAAKYHKARAKVHAAAARYKEAELEYLEAADKYDEAAVETLKGEQMYEEPQEQVQETVYHPDEVAAAAAAVIHKQPANPSKEYESGEAPKSPLALDVVTKAITAAVHVSSNAISHVSSNALSTVRDVFHTLQARNEYVLPKSQWEPPEEERWDFKTPVWEPPAPSNDPVTIEPGSTPHQPTRPESFDKQQLLLDMGFGNRRLNEQLLEKYQGDVDRVIVELLETDDYDWSTGRH